MSKYLYSFLLVFFGQPLLTSAEDISRIGLSAGVAIAQPVSTYYWTSQPVGKTADLLTLNCRNCMEAMGTSTDVPLLSVLRDTLGDASVENDRLSYIWLLSAGHYNLGHRVLSAVPFFYWRPGSGSVNPGPEYPAPLMNLNAPLHPVLAQAGRSLVQWGAIDPISTFVRASSRSYQANLSDYQRLHLEQAINYLHDAPAVSDGVGLSRRELDSLTARLDLRKSFLGGLVQDRHTAALGKQTRFDDERIRSRNFEALRDFAEKTGLYFEPLTLAGKEGEFAMLWFPSGTPQPASGTPSKPIWKLLNIRDPWSDAKLNRWEGYSAQRDFDETGTLLPFGEQGVRTVTLIPLAVYSLNYPRMPLLLIDFRDRLHVRRHEMLQRTITELTSGVIGISHLTNWYYYAGAMAYHDLWSRRGTASSQSDRLDSYAQFRNQLALDHQLDSKLYFELTRRAGSLNVNPLASDPERNVAKSRLEYARLERAVVESNELPAHLDRDRRAELASFGQSAKQTVVQNALHLLSFGFYTDRVSRSPETLAQLDRDRRITYQLEFLDAATKNGTDPRVVFSEAQLTNSSLELRNLLETVQSEGVRRHATETLNRLQMLTKGGEQLAKVSEVAEPATLNR